MLHTTHKRWSIQWRESAENSAARPRALLAPDFPIPRGLDPQAAALLPNIDYNLAMLAGLVERPAHTIVNDIACCYAADPFLDAERFSGALSKRGIHAVSNWPSGIQFGTKFAGLMDQVDLGYDRELRQLQAFEKAGCSVYPVVADQDHARLVYARLRPAGLLLALPPGLPLSTEAFAQRAAQILGVGDSAVPLIFLGAERGAAIDPPLAGAIVCG